MTNHTLISVLTLVMLLSAISPSQTNPKNEDKEVRNLIAQLSQNHWLGVQLVGTSPSGWILHVTRPMKQLFEIGPAAQDALLKRLSDPLIKDQVIILLGGIGDERVIPAIIEMMPDEATIAGTPGAEHINLCATFALTNLTTAAVMWPHAGGNIVLQCNPMQAKRCWLQWWESHRDTFKVKNISAGDRNYPLYPNYGIYRTANSQTVYLNTEDPKK